MVLTLIDFYKGKDFNATFTFKDQDGDTIDVSGYTITFVAKRIGGSDTEISKALSLTNPTVGVATLNLDHADTDVEVGQYQFQFVGEDDGGETHVFDDGTFFVLPSNA